MRDPYEIIVWGPGALGCTMVRELLRRPEFKIVAAVGYSEGKVGRDIAELAGLPAIGVPVTSYAEKERIFAMEADCVAWTGLFPFPGVAEQMDEDVIRLLESGKNVVCGTNYFYLPGHGKEYLKRFEDACRIGGSSLFGTGENPGFWYEREVLNLTALCNEVDYIELREYADCEESGTTDEFLFNFGFGLPPGETPQMKALGEIWNKRYYVESMNLVSMALWGQHLDRLEHETRHFPAAEHFVFSKDKGDGINLDVPEGHTIAMESYFRGYVGDAVKIAMRGYWFLGRGSPFTGKRDSTWEVDIQGKPNSMKCSFEVQATAGYDDDNSTATWYMTAMMVIQGIAQTCQHKPGIVYPTQFTYAAPDYRLLESRKSVVDG